mmetsp:Transcript_17086/g.59822  ORF Transcript_17086/g.59822 Transcript_17086/m.59822 type:complete len:234 (+) Transcript_17086:233-934(+)
MAQAQRRGMGPSLSRKQAPPAAPVTSPGSAAARVSAEKRCWSSESSLGSSPLKSGTRKTCPMATRAARRLNGSPQSGDSSTRWTPKQAASRKTAPTASSSKPSTAKTRKGFSLTQAHSSSSDAAPTPGTAEEASKCISATSKLGGNVGRRAEASMALACLAGTPVIRSMSTASQRRTRTGASPRLAARSSKLVRKVSNKEGLTSSLSTTKSLASSIRMPSGPSAMMEASDPVV